MQSVFKFLADKDRMKEYIDAFGFLAPRQDIMEQQFAEDPEKRTFIKMYKLPGFVRFLRNGHGFP